MKPHEDLADARRRIQTSWSAYAWIMVIFAIIALCGWLIGHYLSYWRRHKRPHSARASLADIWRMGVAGFGLA